MKLFDNSKVYQIAIIDPIENWTTGMIFHIAPASNRPKPVSFEESPALFGEVSSLGKEGVTVPLTKENPRREAHAGVQRGGLSRRRSQTSHATSPVWPQRQLFCLLVPMTVVELSIPSEVNTLLTVVQNACRQRFESDLDLLLVLTEAEVPIPFSRVMEPVPGTPPSRFHGCTDCRPRFAQIVFCATYIYLDIPRTVLSTAQARTLIQNRTGFLQGAGVFAPAQKFYTYRQGMELANDLQFIFEDVLRIPLKSLEFEFSLLEPYSPT